MTNKIKITASTHEASATAAPPPKAEPKVTAKRASNTAAKRAPKAAVKSAVKGAVKSAAKAAVKPAKPAKVAKAAAKAAPKKPAKPRPVLVRDSFTMPESDFALIAQLKASALGARRAAKKSELLRAGLRVLAAMDAESLVLALDSLEAVKTGRPKKGH